MVLRFIIGTGVVSCHGSKIVRDEVPQLHVARRGVVLLGPGFQLLVQGLARGRVFGVGSDHDVVGVKRHKEGPPATPANPIQSLSPATT